MIRFGGASGVVGEEGLIISGTLGLTVGEGGALVGELISAGDPDVFADALLDGEGVADQVRTFRSPSREIRPTRHTSAPATTIVTNNASASRVRRCRAHFILTIRRAGPCGRPQRFSFLLPGRNHRTDILVLQH